MMKYFVKYKEAIPSGKSFWMCDRTKFFDTDDIEQAWKEFCSANADDSPLDTFILVDILPLPKISGE